MFRKDSPQSNEGWYSPRLQRSQRHLRLRSHLQDELDAQGRYPRGDLLVLPSVLHWPQKLMDTAGRIDRFEKKYKATRGDKKAQPTA